MIFHGAPLPPPPENLTTPQLLLDLHHPARPIRTEGNPWLIDDPTGKSYGFEEVRARVQGLANALSVKFKIQENDVVCLFCPNHIEYPIAIWAVHRLGAVISAANPAFACSELLYQLKTSRATLLITHPATESIALDAARQAGIPQDRVIFFAGVDMSPSAAPSTVFLDDLIVEGQRQPLSFNERRLNPGEGKTKLAFLSFSSGTTGKPKAVSISHYNVISNVLQMSEFHRVADPTYNVPWDMKRFRAGDVAAGVLPFFHIYGLVVNMHFLLFCGMSLVVTPKFNFEEMLKSIVRYRITHLLIVPPQVVLFCKHPSVQNYDLSGIRYVMVGAAPLSSELTLQFQKVLPASEIGQAYGMTETCTTVTMYPVTQRHGTPGSAGHILPGVQAKVIKPDGTLGGYGEEGELLVKGPQMTLGYANNPEATKETYIDGWIRTGDEVVLQENGDLFVVDRLKEIFKVRGFQVAPAELEGHLLDHPDVGDAGIIGIPDDFSGEVPLAFIALNPNAVRRVEKDPREGERIKASLVKHVADAKVQYKWLAGGVEFIDAIPKNPSGKILRRFLRERAKDILVQRKAGRVRL